MGTNPANVCASTATSIPALHFFLENNFPSARRRHNWSGFCLGVIALAVVFVKLRDATVATTIANVLILITPKLSMNLEYANAR